MNVIRVTTKMFGERKMKFFYPFFAPLIGDEEKDSLLATLPKGYTSAAKIFYPFVKMPKDWKPRKSAIPHRYYPVKEDILKFGTILTWEEIRRKSGLKSIAEMSIAVTAAITGGEICRDVYCRPELANAIDQVLGEHVYFPLEDELPILLMDDILKVLRSKGAETLQYVNLYGEEGSFSIKNFRLDEMIKLCSEPILLTDEREEFVFTCYFDEVSALFFTKGNCADALKGTQLEGILFDEETPLIWEKHDYQNIHS